jgi:phosphohistidine swiveling domain-containing protein
MENNLINPEGMEGRETFLGSKALKLRQCRAWGLNVPDFLALPSYISDKLLHDGDFRKEIAKKAASTLQAKSYAVRSSALIEDGDKNSLAGQFATKTDVAEEELGSAIYEVLQQAEEYLEGEIDKFSLIVQAYIPADISGVTFTRNPAGGREMVMEYGSCEEDKIVGGKVRPMRLSFYWQDALKAYLPAAFRRSGAIEKFKEIETRSGCAQDIEWCLKDNKLYILQIRPITTISEEQYAEIAYLESSLPKEKYYFEKTEISASAPRPTRITSDLLHLIYGNDGPVSKVYRKYGISYEDTDFLRIFGNELYVDKDREVRGLLPAYGYFSKGDFKPRISRFSGIGRTLRNIFFLNAIGTGSYEPLFRTLKEKIEVPRDETGGMRDLLDRFLSDYEIVFETNLLAGLSLKKLEVFVKDENVSSSEILAGASGLADLERYHVSLPRGVCGNSLEISDDSEFEAVMDKGKILKDKVAKWWKNVSGYRKKMLESRIAEAAAYDRLREFGRWLTVRDINMLRTALVARARKEGFEDSRDIFFASLDEVLSDKVVPEECAKRRKEYDRYASFCLPGRLTSSLVLERSVLAGVSSGQATGVLLTAEMIEKSDHADKEAVLYTEIMSADLTRYFDRICGIVSENGGMLSHLAIMARERGIPAVAGFSLENSGLKIGDMVRIDGGSGKVSGMGDAL